MRVIVLFDLPSVTKTEKRNYVRYRKHLLDDGYLMLQYSIYARFCRNVQDANKHIKRAIDAAPTDGNIRILSITEKQFEDMILVIGEKGESEEVVNSEYMVEI